VPEQEADYINKLMEIYISQGLEAKNQMADSTIMFIDRQISIIADSLKEAEDNLQNFRLENKLVVLSSEGSFIQERLRQFENEKASLELQHRYYQYLKEYLDTRKESGDIVSPSIMGVTDPTLEDWFRILLTCKGERTACHEPVGEFTCSKSIGKSIVIVRKTLYENFESNLINIKNLVNNADEKIVQVNQEIRKLPGIERKMINIQRKFDLNNTNLYLSS